MAYLNIMKTYRRLEAIKEILRPINARLITPALVSQAFIWVSHNL